MSRSPSPAALALLAVCLVLAAAPARAGAVLDVSGHVVASAPRLEVRVTLTNRGDHSTGAIDVTGELGPARAEARLAGGLEPGAAGSVTLALAPAPARSGRHALTLLLEHPLDGPPDGAGNPPLASERAFLLLALGADPSEAVRLRAEPLALDVRGALRVQLESLDETDVRVALRALTPRGLRASDAAVEVVVPAKGRATAELELVRAGAARGTRQVLLLVAEALDGPLARTAVAAAAVEVQPDPSRLERHRPLLLGIGVALTGLALAFEAWGRLVAPRRTKA